MNTAPALIFARILVAVPQELSFVLEISPRPPTLLALGTRNALRPPRTRLVPWTLFPFLDLSRLHPPVLAADAAQLTLPGLLTATSPRSSFPRPPPPPVDLPRSHFEGFFMGLLALLGGFLGALWGSLVPCGVARIARGVPWCPVHSSWCLVGLLALLEGFPGAPCTHLGALWDSCCYQKSNFIIR